MMKKFGTAFVFCMVLASVIFIGCKKKTADRSTSYLLATITHQGFDFSTGGIPASDQYADGETVGWEPGFGVNPNYPNNDIYIWWRNKYIDTVNYQNQTKDMGIVDMATVTQVPGSWDVSPNILPLLAGHVIVAKCKDGYVKFEVVSANASTLWPAQVYYYFSSSATFSE